MMLQLYTNICLFLLPFPWCSQFSCWNGLARKCHVLGRYFQTPTIWNIVVRGFKTPRISESESSTLKFIMFSVKGKLFPIVLVAPVGNTIPNYSKHLEIFPKIDMWHIFKLMHPCLYLTFFVDPRSIAHMDFWKQTPSFLTLHGVDILYRSKNASMAWSLKIQWNH